MDKPTVGDDELLVRVRAASVNLYDWHTMRADLRTVRLARGLLKPRANGLGADHLGVLKDLVEDGDVMPVIDRTYPLSEVSKAMQYLETGQPQGKVVISV